MSGQRLKIFAGPNGSGKTTLFEALAENYETGIFLNADYIEQELSITGFIDLNRYGLHLEEDDLQNFLKTDRAKSLLAKSLIDSHTIDIAIRENIIVNIEKGNQRPTLFTVLQIARFLNVEVTHLIPEEKRNPFEGVSIFGLGIDKAKILNENSNVYTFLQSI